MKDDAIIGKILKFVRQVDGGDSDEEIRKCAIARAWLDAHGAPTRDGERLARSLDLMNQLGGATSEAT